MKKMLTLICVFTVTVSSFFSSVIFVSADTTKQAATTSSADTSIELTVDINQRYTGGLDYDGNKLSQNISAKALYIGVICVFLLAGVVIIAVKARRSDDDDSDSEEENAKIE